MSADKLKDSAEKNKPVAPKSVPPKPVAAKPVAANVVVPPLFRRIDWIALLIAFGVLVNIVAAVQSVGGGPA